jgi:hypothetical protein
MTARRLSAKRYPASPPMAREASTAKRSTMTFITGSSFALYRLAQAVVTVHAARSPAFTPLGALSRLEGSGPAPNDRGAGVP